jgi:hypothetical protein
MSKKALLVLGAVVGAITIPVGTAATVYSLLDYQSAVDSLLAIDSTIDPPPNDPAKDFAVGGFQGPDNNNVGFSGHSSPLGEDAQGKLSETVPLFYGTPPRTYQGRFTVTCLMALGNDAALGLVPTDAASNDQPAEFVLDVHDSGLPGGTGDQYVFIPDVEAQDCTALVGTAALFGFPIERGNILVHDALP